MDGSRNIFLCDISSQFKKIDMKKFLIYFMKGVLGEEAARCIVNDKEKK